MQAPQQGSMFLPESYLLYYNSCQHPIETFVFWLCCSFSDKDKTQRLEEQIKLHHLHLLMKAFQEHRPGDIIKQAGSAYFPAKVEKRTPGAMNLEEFKATVAQVLKTNEYEEYLEKLFTKVPTGVMHIPDCNLFKCTFKLYVILTYEEIKSIRIKHIRVFNVCNNILQPNWNLQ